MKIFEYTNYLARWGSRSGPEWSQAAIICLLSYRALKEDSKWTSITKKRERWAHRADSKMILVGHLTLCVSFRHQLVVLIEKKAWRKIFFTCFSLQVFCFDSEKISNFKFSSALYQSIDLASKNKTLEVGFGGKT